MERVSKPWGGGVGGCSGAQTRDLGPKTNTRFPGRTAKRVANVIQLFFAHLNATMALDPEFRAIWERMSLR